MAKFKTFFLYDCPFTNNLSIYKSSGLRMAVFKTTLFRVTNGSFQNYTLQAIYLDRVCPMFSLKKRKRQVDFKIQYCLTFCIFAERWWFFLASLANSLIFSTIKVISFIKIYICLFRGNKYFFLQSIICVCKKLKKNLFEFFLVVHLCMKLNDIRENVYNRQSIE